VFDKLKGLFGGAPQETTRTGRQRPDGAGPRRPARPRKARSGRGGGSKADASLESGPLTGGGSLRSPSPTPREIPCPNCGESMLPGWGTTCGKCRPNLVAPKTLFMDVGQLSNLGNLSPSLARSALSQASSSMTLGWLVVMASADSTRRGTLIELDHEDTILSRADAMPSNDDRVFAFSDVFMSSGHAVLRRPRTGNREDAFTIRDRDNPGPSANGTFVNSRRLGAGETIRLADGDTIQVGSTELLFRSLWLPALSARGS
jgi:hypothetical protein